MSSSAIRRILAPVILLLLPSPLPAQSAHGPTTVRRDVRHDMSPPLFDMMRNSHPISHGKLEAEPARRIPLPPGFEPLAEDPVRQLTTSGYSPQAGLSIEGIGDGQYGFTVEYIPPDTNGAVGATQYVQWVNTYFAVFNKTNGALIAGPVAANTLWTGFGGNCENDNDGDPIVTYDKLANRWVMTQLSISYLPYMECVAVSATSDATGSWYRYAFQYSYLDDYPKIGVWPDAYYETFNLFNGENFVGADACAYNRTAMLSGQSATQICFQQTPSVGSLLPADVDGTTPPPSGAPNYMLNYGANSLNLYKFHVDFNNPSNSTFTGPTVISVAAFTPLCNGASGCVPQPTTDNKLDSLADRLMHRLAYRNFGTHESLVVNHSVAVNRSSGIRWYEIQSPATTPVVAQQGTYAPDSNYRWMGSIAMDKVGDIAVGYSISGTSVYPSIAYAGRVPSDPAGQLESETSVMVGSGSQTPNVTRWGDYSSMSVDPIDDCTFWYTQEYILSNGAFNWNTRIVSFQFPGCTAGGYVGFYPNNLSFGEQNVGTTSPSQPITLSNHTSSALTISSIVPAGDFSETNNCGASLAPNASCNINVSFHPTASGVRTGTLTVTDSGPGSPRVANLTGLGTVSASCVADMLSNGGFETGGLDCWSAGGALIPVASTLQAHSGAFSAQLGAIGTPVPNGDSWIYQTITVPTSVQSPTLTFWYWPSTQSSLQNDWQEAQIRDGSGNKLAQIFKTASNAQQWTYVSFDLTPYQGQTVQLYFNAHEDGGSTPTYMYLDDVAIAGAATPQRFIPITPCRVADTRNSTGPFGGPAMGADSTRSFPLPQGGCGIPSTATAYALNVTVVPHLAPLGYLIIWPTGLPQPVVSTLNSYDGRVKANAAIVPAGTNGAVSVYVTNTTDVVLDITGYFTTGNNSALAFFSMPPCRVADTRGADGPFGGPMLHSGVQRDFPVLSSACDIPAAAAAYSMNFTVVPKNGRWLSYLAVWPTGHSQPVVSTLNAYTGTIVANAAIVTAGTGGDIETIAVGNDSDLIIDINGYFAPAASGQNPMALYTLTPCRVLDTRQSLQQPFTGELTVDVTGSPCGIPGNATGYVFNATVVPPGLLGFLELWPDGQTMPVVSTLNAIDGAVTSNMAIVPTTNGYIDAYAPEPTQLILDISAYFAP